MSLSGSFGVLPFTAIQMIEESCSRAGISPDKITAEIGAKALDQLNLIFTSLLNRGIQLWKRQQLILPCYVNQNTINLPAGFNIVTTLNRRQMNGQYGGVAFSDSGGTAANAFDQNFTTSCAQTAPNGSIGRNYTSVGGVQVTTVGTCFAATGQFTLFYEWSNDNVTWTPVDASTVNVGFIGQWQWDDLSGYPDSAMYWRVRSVSTLNFAVEEIFFGNTPTEVNLGQWNLDEYAQMPNKTAGGSVVNWYQQRNLNATTLYVWPTPNDAAAFDTLVVWATQYLNSVTQVSQSLDLPARWYDAVTAMLATRLCLSLKEADMKRYPILQDAEMKAVELAEGEERDPAPVNIDMGMEVYTR